MFCPKCAGQNIDGASFCRSCGVNISLVSQALTGQPAVAVDENRVVRRSRRRTREATIDHALKNVFGGIAFLFVALALAWSGQGRFWWYWLLIPAFSSLGKGIAEYSRLRGERKTPLPLPGYVQPSFAPPRTLSSFPARNTGEMVPPPPSVTEGTTRHLGAEAPTRHLDTTGE